jgi:hypothetical protein
VYEWLEHEIGFYPFFFSVGTDESALHMTGYDDNWRVRTGCSFVRGKRRNLYRHKGQFPNLALFSFEKIEGTFMDFQSWHIALNAVMNQNTVTAAERKMIFKPSWDRARWIRAARNGTHSVQLVAPVLPLEQATRVYVRNKGTRMRLCQMGFPDPEVKRVPVLRYY